MRFQAVLLVLASLFSAAHAQVVNTGVTDNFDSVSVGKIYIGGMVDTYYGLSSSFATASNRYYAVSSHRTNEMNINLAFIDVKYKNNKVRAHFVPGFGTYMNENYAGETGSLKNIVEANVGVKLSKKKEIWLDAGVISSPFTNESAISKDHLMYTRSLSGEYVPYYLSGVKLSVPINNKFAFYGYVINGWQEITNKTKGLALATQLEYRPNKNVLINWDTYMGNEQTAIDTNIGMRYFTDVYLIYQSTKKFSLTSSAYVGMQKRLQHTSYWYQANVIGKWDFNKQHSLSGRLEYFNDAHLVVINSAFPDLTLFGAGLCYNYKINNNALFRLEYRYYNSGNRQQFIESGTSLSNAYQFVMGNLTVWF